VGLLSLLPDAYFLSKCSSQIKHVVPDRQGFAESFCRLTKDLLLAMKKKGANHADAVSMTCLYLLESKDSYDKNEDPGFDKAHCLQLAYFYCTAFIERWPDTEYSQIMKKLTDSFAIYARRPDSGILLL
jgi:hypothetical protein